MSKLKAAALPHSWRAHKWPVEVAPNDSDAAKHLIRTHKEELIACGALGRIGRELIIYGEGYGVFLARKRGRVANYIIPPNRERSEPATP